MFLAQHETISGAANPATVLHSGGSIYSTSWSLIEAPPLGKTWTTSTGLALPIKPCHDNDPNLTDPKTLPFIPARAQKTKQRTINSSMHTWGRKRLEAVFEYLIAGLCVSTRCIHRCIHSSTTASSTSSLSLTTPPVFPPSLYDINKNAGYSGRVMGCA